MADSNLKLAAIRYYSIMNPWIDIIAIVPLEYEKKAVKCIRKALKIDFWDDTDDRFYDFGYCDYARDELDKDDIPSSIVCFDDFSENDILFDGYAKFIMDSGIKYIDVS